MDYLQTVKAILGSTLSLGSRAERLTTDSPLLGGIAEFDSMAVVSVVTAIEDELGVMIDDDELTADTFRTVGSLVELVRRKASV